MNANLPGILIRRKRLQHNLSQEGLCKGICSVGYLSKIEQGKAEASDEICSLLLARLGVDWLSRPDALQRSHDLAEALWEATLSYERAHAEALMQSFRAERERLLNGPDMLDFLLFERLFGAGDEDTLEPYSSVLNHRQQGLRLCLNRAFDVLLNGWPSAYYYLMAGLDDYWQGANTRAVERLLRAYELASQEGRARVMLEAKLLSGSCYCNLGEYARMQEHYAVAERLATSLGDEKALQNIHYNTACADLELGRVEAALQYFAHLPNPSKTDCHKKAICYELLSQRAEALAALTQAETATTSEPDASIVDKMCALVRFRLEHEDYLQQEEYGTALLDCFQLLKRELPRGYAQFHLRWLAEWYQAHRQYRQLAQLYLDFPVSSYNTNLKAQLQ